MRFEHAQRIVRAHAPALSDAFARGVEGEAKGARDLVTELDRSTESALREAITEEFEDDSIVGEEGDDVHGNSGYTWLIDPIDGTGNFVHGIPIFNIAIACLHEGTPVFGVVLAPVSGDLYAASTEAPATRNGVLIEASERELSAAFLGFCHGKSEQSIRSISSVYERFKLDAHDFRKLGSANLEISMVASGRIHGFVGYDIKPWDFIPACFIAERAGCTITGFSGEDWRSPSVTSVLVAPPKLHGALLERVRSLR